MKKCFEFASKMGYKYAGLQYGGYCFAGNEVGKYGQKGDGECFMPCEGDKGRTCGASWKNSVFSVPEFKYPAHETVIGEKYLGCYVDKKDRDIPHHFEAG